MNANIDLTAKHFDTQKALEKIAADTRTAIVGELEALAYYTQAQTLITQAEQEQRAAKSDLSAARQAYSAAEKVVAEAEAAVRRARAKRELIPEIDQAARGAASTAVDQAAVKVDDLQRDLNASHRQRVIRVENTLTNLEALLAALRQIEKPTAPHLAAVIKAAR